MRCATCATDNAAGARFCQQCGQPLARVCPHCTMPVSASARFCQHCGANLAATAPTTNSTPGPGSARPVAADTVAEPGPARGAPADGERKQVTVLFTDIVGSTALAADLDPEEWSEIVTGVHQRVSAAVDRYQGTVAQLLGDGVLAFFGAPVTHEDDPVRAVSAALDILAAVGDDARELTRQQRIPALHLRVGLQTGLVVVGSIGSAAHMEYLAVGDTVNLAARLQAAAPPDHILISASTARLVKHAFDLEPYGPVEMKGKAEPVPAFRVVARKAVLEPARGLEGLDSPLVGRDAEFQRLLEKVAGLRGGRGAVVTVLGEAGLGKSRLIAEVRKLATGGVLARDPGAAGGSLTWLEGRAVSYGHTLPYDPWRQIIRQAIGAREDEASEAVREKLQCNSECCVLPGSDLPFLEMLLAVESEAALATLSSMAGDELLRHITAAVRGYLCALARTGPTVIVFDDLHWADVASLDLLSRVVDLVESWPLLIVCLSRADHDAPSWPVVTRLRDALGAAYTDIDLEPLDAEQAQDLLAHLLHIEDLPASVRALILSTSEGNPFYLEELIRSLIDSRHIVRENGHWRATREIATVALPDTLSGVLSARIDRLPDEPKRVVQAAAVLGRIFGYRTLKAMCATAPPAERIEAVAAHLDTLTREELLRERARDPELEYIFKHALTQQTAYDLLLLRRRKELHRRAGETLAHLYPERHSELAPMLAHHFWLGEDWPRAAEHALRAGGRAVTMHALREAFEHYERAITALERQPEAPASQIVAATLAWTWVAYKRRRHDDETHRAEMLARLARAEALARTQSDTSALAQVLIWTANVNLLSGFPGRAFAYLSEGYRLAMELGEDRLCIVPMFLSTFSMVDTDPRGAVERLDQVIALTQTYANPEVEAHAQGMKALAHARLGEFVTARAAIVAAEDRVSASLSTVNQADVNVSIGQAYIDMGEIERGLALTRRGAEVSASVGGLECACVGQIFTGLGYLRQPDLPQAQAALEEALRLVEHTSELAAAMLKPGAEAGLAIARFAATQQPEAIQEMEQLLAAAQGPDDAFVAAFLNLALAQARTRLGAYDRAEGHLNNAVAFYRRTGMRPYLMMTLEAGAVLYEAQGRAAEADQTRAEAERLRHELW